MEEEEDEDIYAPTDIDNGSSARMDGVDTSAVAHTAGADLEEGEEEGEEVEEDDTDSDIDIITERKDVPKPEPGQTQRSNTVKPSAVKGVASEHARPSPSPTIKIEAQSRPTATPPRSGASYPAVRTSKIDVDVKPVYEANGKPITQIDMDADFPEDDKPWRRPGTDMTDYFNYGFDEFTWASYCLKQESVRKEVADSKKQMDDMQSFLAMPGGMAGMPGAASGAMPNIGAPADMPPEMAQMMQQMMATGMDPSQMSPEMFMQYMMQGGQNAGGQGGMGGAQGYGQQGQGHQQNYGYGGGGSGGGGTGWLLQGRQFTSAMILWALQ
ncbi:MAG: hypothetical protein Q9191_006588 [Dirinaria sp. TL-2023a]